MLLFGLYAILQSKKFVEQKAEVVPWSSLLILWGTTILAFAFHLSFVFGYAGLLLWSLLPLFHKDRSLILKRYFLLYAPPVFVLSVYWLFYLRTLPEGTGPLGGEVISVLDLLSSIVGGPLFSVSSPIIAKTNLVVATLTVVFSCIGLMTRLKSSQSDGFFFLCVAVLGPLLVVGVINPRILMVRYFLLQAFFIMVLVASALNEMSCRTKGGAILAAILAFASIYGNTAHLVQFIAFRRGEYSEVVATLRGLKSTEVSVDHQFRHKMMLSYFGPEIKVVAAPSEFEIHHSQDLFAAPRSGRPGCTLSTTQPFAGLSGWATSVFHCEVNANPSAQ